MTDYNRLIEVGRWKEGGGVREEERMYIILMYVRMVYM